MGPLVGLFFGDGPVTDYAGARRSVANGLYARFFGAMLARGIALAPGPYEAMFPGFTHTDDVLDTVVAVAADAAEALVADAPVPS